MQKGESQFVFLNWVTSSMNAPLDPQLRINKAAQQTRIYKFVFTSTADFGKG
jgi:hypothetical protein